MARRQACWQRAAVMDRGDVYLVSLDPTSGHEQQGTRPVLIVSPSAFNRLTKTPVVLPITSGGNFARTAGFTVSLMGAGTNTTGVVRCDQPRALDLASRRGRKLETVPSPIMDEILAKLSAILE
ncbi:type II toxin-antitoxin system PemK/MazF family toxin [Xanthomonas vasicola pv. vasculorum]|nr:type II toxin-antitoxin system PemK/MazF family toxin [Xanthomonas vasicola pv. vasculorum NCPPB 890]MBV6892719.1 type II toxin-antitoxin system PemK/MazF family toxin [Xanthomonas vasicola pv. vasculorum]